MEPLSRFGSGSWAFSSSLVTRRGSRRFSFRRTRGWGATRRRGRCCTSFDRAFSPSRATPEGPHRGRRDLHRWLSQGMERAWSGQGRGAIAVERRGRAAGCVRLAVIPAATTAVLTSFVKGAIVPQAATVHIDAWAAYRALRKLGIDHRPRRGGHGRHLEDGLPWAHTVTGSGCHGLRLS